MTFIIAEITTHSMHQHMNLYKYDVLICNPDIDII